jgi:hypothetical protein
MREARQGGCARHVRADARGEAGRMLEAKQGKLEAKQARYQRQGRTDVLYKAG